MRKLLPENLDIIVVINDGVKATGKIADNEIISSR
jgi:hypothetical protein